MTTIKEDIIKGNNLTNGKTKCNCGHTLTIPAFKDGALCRWCGQRVKNKSIDYFKYKLREKIKDVEDEKNESN